MPTRKQRKKALKERRHEYETVWVDEEGNELDEPPEEALARTASPRAKGDGKKAPAKARQQQRGGRAARTPLPPSWRRAFKRTFIWVGVLAVLFVLIQSRQKNANYGGVIVLCAIYAIIFPVFTYYLDRTVYRRYLKREGKDVTKR